MKVSCGFLFPLKPGGTFSVEEKGIEFALNLLCPIFLPLSGSKLEPCNYLKNRPDSHGALCGFPWWRPMKLHGKEETACRQGGWTALGLLISCFISVQAISQLINCLSEKGQAFIFESHLPVLISSSLKTREGTECSYVVLLILLNKK